MIATTDVMNRNTLKAKSTTGCELFLYCDNTADCFTGCWAAAGGGDVVTLTWDPMATRIWTGENGNLYFFSFVKVWLDVN